jgi:hypothetical protein
VDVLPLSSHGYGLRSSSYLRWFEEGLALRNSHEELDKDTAEMLRATTVSIFHTTFFELLCNYPDRGL